MICDDCRSAIENTPCYQDKTTKPWERTGRWLEYRSLTKVRKSCTTGCCICRRVETIIRASSDREDNTHQVFLIYKVEDHETYHWISLYANAESFYDPSKSWSHDGHSFNFMLLPGLATEVEELQSSTLAECTSVEKSKRYILWRIKACQKDHHQCRRGDWWRPDYQYDGPVTSRVFSIQDSWQPTRLLEISVDKTTGLITVRVVTSAQGSCVAYTALSHCWGGITSHKLQSDNFEQLTNGIACESLPKTFRDAIEVTRWLGIRHIWIDSLCIIQNSVDDWKHESAQMHEVYQFAFVTISASAAKDSQGGLFFASQKVVSHAVPSLRLHETVPADRTIIDAELWSTNIKGGPLRRRAWTLQERLLSSRLLHFGEEEIFWQCAQSMESQSYPGDLARQHYQSSEIWTRECSIQVYLALRGKRTDVHRSLWHNIVRDYSRCELTYETDKLVAIGGLARWLHRYHGDPYYAGLWEDDMLFQLVWYVAGPQANGEPSRRAHQYVAPSWSWASIIGSITPGYSQLTLRAGSGLTILAKIVDVGVQKAGPTSFGQITGGHLRLIGTIYNITLQKIEGSPPQIVYNGIRRDQPGVAFDIDPGTESQDLAVLPLWVHSEVDANTVHGLLLKIVDKGTATYSRVGRILLDQQACQDLQLKLQPLCTSGPVSRTYSGSDIGSLGFDTVTIV